MTLPTRAYKVLTGPQMEELVARGRFVGAPVDLADGYIHLSTESQLAETVLKHFAGQDDLWIATVDLVALHDDLRWEPSRGGQLFPHLYADLPMDAVLAHGPLVWATGGTIALPG
jgi:uncharacterized protein (DUF952 family)